MLNKTILILLRNAVILKGKEMLNENLEQIVDAIENINTNPDNSFGVSLGDQLYELTYQVQRIADTLEKIEAKMK